MKQTSSAAVEFSWKQFWVSLLYENLPPVIFSPFAALLVERSFARAWNVCQNRNLLIAPSHNNPLYFVLFSWLITYPASWLITCGLLMVMALALSGALNRLDFCLCGGACGGWNVSGGAWGWGLAMFVGWCDRRP